MITRAIDSGNDWKFGKGKQDYLIEKDSLNQNIKTKLQSFVGDCFFDTLAGIDWFKFLGSKNQIGLKNAVSKEIMNVQGVYSLDELSFSLDANRKLLIKYAVTSLWSQSISNTVNLG